MQQPVSKLFIWLCFSIPCPLVGSQLTLSLAPSKETATPSVAQLFYEERHMNFVTNATPLIFSGASLELEPMLEEQIPTPALSEFVDDQTRIFTLASTPEPVPAPSKSKAAPASSNQQNTPSRIAAATVIAATANLNAEERPLQCKYCEARFAKENHLKTHMKVHPGKE